MRRGCAIYCTPRLTWSGAGADDITDCMIPASTVFHDATGSYVYSGDKSAVAALSPIVEEAFLAGDSIAADIIKKNACCIVDNIECVVGKLQLTFGRVALHGGVVNNETCMRREIISLMKKRLPYFSCIHPEKDALHGALMMAREMVKGETT